MRIEFQHQAVRDLAWVIGSPSLLAGEAERRVSDAWCRLAFHDRIPWLRELDRDPSELLAWLASHKSRLLGVYFESLVEYWLIHWRRMQLHAARLSLMGTERAVGEFDFLFRDRYLGIEYHWETAVKFFLHHQQGHGRGEWLGPNPRDTLQGKRDKVFGHQLTLSYRPEARPVLQRLGIDTLRPKAFFKGYLFEHSADEAEQSQGLACDISPHHLKGWWCHFSERQDMPQGASGNRWLSLSRLHWLSPVYNKETAPGMGREECLVMLEAHFDGSDKPLLLAELGQGSDGIWRECRRGFVVADHWPALVHRRGDTISHHE